MPRNQKLTHEAIIAEYLQGWRAGAVEKPGKVRATQAYFEGWSDGYIAYTEARSRIVKETMPQEDPTP